MSTLTKILIVVMVVLSIFYSVLAIQHVSVSPNWKQAHSSERSRRLATEATARNDRMAKENLIGQMEDLQKANSQLAKDAEDRASRDKVAIAQLQAENARLTNTLEGMNTKLAGLEGSVGEQVTMTKQLSSQLVERLAAIQELNDQLRKTTLQAQELSRNLETARQNVSVKQTLLTSAEEKVRELHQKLRQGGGTALAGGAPVPIPSVRIEGRIEAVSLEDNVAQLNVGAASGVEKGMKFILYRGSEYVGDLTVAQVEASNCAGTLSSLQAAPQQGDKAATDLMID